MPVQQSLWTIGKIPLRVATSKLANETQLEDMIIAEPRILSDEWMLIGRQIDTTTGGRVDLLAIAPDASLVLIELKKDKTPREVISQVLDYGYWVGDLEAGDIAAIYARFKPGCSLAKDFRTHFGHDLVEDEINQVHQLVVAASSLDPRTERIVRYLDNWDIPINILYFEIFQQNNIQLMSRSWLLDPVQVQDNVSTGSVGHKEPWNGEFYACFGHGNERLWEEAVEYGFISAGGGAWYSNTLNFLTSGARVWVKVPANGFVGVGRVTGPRQSASEFKVGDRSPHDVLKGNYHKQYLDDADRSEYFVPVNWLETIALDKAIQETGMFGNQNTVCRPRTPGWRTTVERLKVLFPRFDGDSI